MKEDYDSFLLRFFNDHKIIKQKLEKLKPSNLSLNKYIINILGEYVMKRDDLLKENKNLRRLVKFDNFYQKQKPIFYPLIVMVAYLYLLLFLSFFEYIYEILTTNTPLHIFNSILFNGLVFFLAFYLLPFYFLFLIFSNKTIFSKMLNRDKIKYSFIYSEKDLENKEEMCDNVELFSFFDYHNVVIEE